MILFVLILSYSLGTAVIFICQTAAISVHAFMLLRKGIGMKVRKQIKSFSLMSVFSNISQLRLTRFPDQRVSD